MKKLMIVLGMSLIVCSIILLGCKRKSEGEKKKDLIGTYVNQDDSEEYFVLEEDGTYRYHHEKLGYDLTGEWEVKGDKLIVSYPTTGPMPPSKIKGNKIIGDDGSVHIKVKERNPAPPKPASIVGKYIGKCDSGEEVRLELKEDGTALFGVAFSWEVVWYETGNRPYSPSLNLLIFKPNSSDICLSLVAGNGKEPIHTKRGPVRVDFWHISDDVLQKGEGAEIIKLNKVRSPGRKIEETVFYPSEVEVWSRYTGTIHGSKEVLEFKRIPNYTPSGWKRTFGSDGLCTRYSISKWSVSDNKLKLSFESGDKVETIEKELEIKGNTLIDKKWGITFVKQK